VVPGDVVKLSLGDVVSADVKLTGGEVLLDQSMLTGESVPIEAGAGVQTYAGALVRRGEAEAEVTATGARTKFGRTTATDATGGAQRIVKGAFAAVIDLAQPSQTAVAAAKELEDKGFRVLAVAAGPTTAMKLVGLIALSGPPFFVGQAQACPGFRSAQCGDDFMASRTPRFHIACVQKSGFKATVYARCPRGATLQLPRAKGTGRKT
jgi:E1-E2 ATPase